MSRPCNQLREKRCSECGRRGVKAFTEKRVIVGGHELKLWRCSNRRRCSERGFDLQAALELWHAAFVAEAMQRKPLGERDAVAHG